MQEIKQEHLQIDVELEVQDAPDSKHVVVPPKIGKLNMFSQMLRKHEGRVHVASILNVIPEQPEQPENSQDNSQHFQMQPESSEANCDNNLNNLRQKKLSSVAENENGKEVQIKLERKDAVMKKHLSDSALLVENFGHNRNNNLAEKAKQIKRQTKVESIYQADDSLQFSDSDSSISVSDQ